VALEHRVRRSGRGATLRRQSKGNVLSTKQHWPTWVTVVAIVILIPPIVWALSGVLSIVAALSIGGILLIVGVVALFVWGLKRAES